MLGHTVHVNDGRYQGQRRCTYVRGRMILLGLLQGNALQTQSFAVCKCIVYHTQNPAGRTWDLPWVICCVQWAKTYWHPSSLTEWPSRNLVPLHVQIHSMSRLSCHSKNEPEHEGNTGILILASPVYLTIVSSVDCNLC